MTNPPAPGQPQRPPGPGGPGGPYGPPPPPHPASVPGPRPQSPAPPPQYQQPQQPEWAPPERTDKGLVGALFDANFNYMVTPKLIKLWYILSMLLVSFQCLVFFCIGLWIAAQDDFWAWGILMVVASPLVWLFELLLVRILMEAVVVRFKGVEYLRIIKDKI
ncbi:DUF4282 domain-containing protein [Actinomadura xylanilytica]|uniref:DUF4282 domain-containing protein n=1 Tax=Actinomadura xylanilytica TaxID=887459 RepID=UPI00255AFF87|nr:DUF4282 domain-containing protein [Actinomadura xylanilytica]MDL4772219.1 DUF4282 domain-containing protein [Actinomadura xylanilytica]